jgi:hypothetical protein
MRHILYEHKYCGFFLAKRIFGYRDEERVQYSSHKGIFEYRDEENPHTVLYLTIRQNIGGHRGDIGDPVVF